MEVAGNVVTLAHNPKVRGSNPLPATKQFKDLGLIA